MAAKKILFIEGASETENGSLREGFSKLLSKKLNMSMPRIIMGGGKRKTIDKFINNTFQGKKFLLCDLDAPDRSREKDLENHSLSEHDSSVCYMIQEMESWFLSQPEVLNSYYGPTKAGTLVSERIKGKVTEISAPKEVLKHITKDLNKGKGYHEINHAVDLLERLDATQLENDFPDFKRLIAILK